MSELAASSVARPGSDDSLLAACRAGDEVAFLELVRRHHPALHALARCWPVSAYDAERDVAAAWLAVLRAAPAAASPCADPSPHAAADQRPETSAAPSPCGDFIASAADSPCGDPTAPVADSPSDDPTTHAATGRAPSATASSLRTLVAREVLDAAVRRTHAVLEPAPPHAVDAGRFFGADHELWPGEWADPPRPWGSSAGRRLSQRDIPRVLARCVRELGIAPSALVTLHDVHGWPMSDCATALRRTTDEARALLRAGREGLRAAVEAEIDSR
jgi:DNA-directed RNA polymerase specialized sigma24 family protein